MLLVNYYFWIQIKKKIPVMVSYRDKGARGMNQQEQV
ncbi:hypothetical protein SHWT1_47 [Salmonella phage SHWT1]|uniref:Uncharacterized protein n=1 Tax=Salmonella phage SHWT1 TaxID=2759195 RepID=A0A7G8AKN1_9CAUD|nr:hypothetical protein QA056_gp47 [Salmonella phage SHWT1]QNI20476.1 hypothetical protein SHWT1_47 [Salmonella phage SHWT1]